MIQFNIQWSKALLSELDREIYAHFFAVVRGQKIVYIGNANGETLRTLLESTLASPDFHGGKTEIYLGRIREYGTRRIPAETIEGLHQLLVYARKPRLNRRGKLRYNGLANLRVTNSGCELLPYNVRAENRIVFLSMKNAAKMRYQPGIAG
ncbi:MAG: hypothetical protein AAF998_03085 [Bacteroidota bacterium]